MRDDANLGDQVHAVSRSLRKRAAAVMAEHDLTPAQARALRVVLAHDEPPRLSHVAERLGVAPRTATEVVDALERRGLVIRAPDPDDRRALRVSPTEGGVAMGHVMARARREISDAYFDVLGSDDRATLRRILTQLEERS